MSSPDQTNMTNPPVKQTKMVKIRAKHAIRIMRREGNQDVEHIVSPGQVVEVSEADAKEFCDKQINIGVKQVFGNRDSRDVKSTFVVRAERVKSN